MKLLKNQTGNTIIFRDGTKAMITKPTQIRDYNYQQVQSKIPKQNDIVIEALYALRQGDAETIQAWINAKYSRMLPITSVRRSLTNLTNVAVRPIGRRKNTQNGGTATIYELTAAAINKLQELPF